VLRFRSPSWVVTSVDEVRRLLRLGADKVTINTEAVRRPAFITECARVFGAQCMVVAIDVRRDPDGSPVVWVDRGAEADDVDRAGLGARS